MDRRTRRELIERLNRDGAFLAGRFELRYRTIEAERADVTSRYGVCYDDGTIRIRLRHSVTGEPLKYSSLISTLCHELAHLRHFNHGPRFRSFYAAILRCARDEGIYRPARRAGSAARPGPKAEPTHPDPRRPRSVAPDPGASRQLSLFERPTLSRQPSWES